MKKIVVCALVALTAVSAVFGQQVLSRNAVGYQQLSLPKGQLSLVRHDFEALDTSLAVSNIFAGLPNQSRIHFWKLDQSGYYTISKAAIGGWGTGGTSILYRGQSVWVEIPAAAASNQYQVFMMGEVPDRFSAPSSTVSVVPGITFAGYSYPVEQKWTNLSLARQAPNGSRLHTWNGANYVTYSKAAIGGWGAAGNALTITPGQGFLLQWAAATNWNEVKPYTWP